MEQQCTLIGKKIVIIYKYLLPVIGVEKIFHFDGSHSPCPSNMFSIKYQLFLNDIYFWGAMELLTYTMTRTYLSDIDFALTTQKQIRFNQRMDRLYLDVSWEELTAGDWLVMDCFRTLDPNDYKEYGMIHS